ncbi:NRAMP family divalent metal transporter [Neisseria weaveri]|uniref:NRAMP family divalent metal transporter n=1 Tax=Neisseria weaveri TaxID=28091 RepID=UPI0002231A50|nr:NRAMP family divalent metal transporter [Neisseria weaveri]EGV36781.1 aspartyl-tRNA synthetase [Neisseria weaveri ATCC 51223]SAY51537.1 membrane protein [Neisseria weaveri]
MSEAVSHSQSTWQSKLRAIGPGVLMASAAVGGSHIIASTQAGAIYGWQLAVIIILVNLFKYPFFRFGAQYTLDTGKSLLEGYRDKHPFYLWAFFVLNLFATVVNIAGVALITAVILSFMLPGVPINLLAGAVLAVTLLVLLAGKYHALDVVSKIVMVALTVATVLAVAIAAGNGGATRAPDFIEPSPWNMAALGFIIALMGWMPAPIEFSAINSLWVSVKRKLDNVSYSDGLLDFHIGYVGSAVLAVIFLALGALVQFGTGEEVKLAGPAYIAQLIEMYARTIGEWSRWLVAFIAFACMFGTTLTAVDGYSRANTEAFRLLMKEDSYSTRALNVWIVIGCVAGMIVILFFKGSLAPMLKFAMITAFLTTPVFAWLNLVLARKAEHKIGGLLMLFSWLGLIYLAGFAVLFLLQLAGVLGV